ncbi:hypothetical protein D5H75_07340 [Bailinhaonella thermotolerans]|uniref:Uncharacterized protein n=1 Tax=Bailinhaonella thermotolerans TaxID=1070861 RepID=A0A3A4BSH2_9ACTN|nr:hypothetical protein D5H75_07340 [Bailinhaonella thermotolerans]
MAGAGADAGAGSREPGAGSREPGAGSWEPGPGGRGDIGGFGGGPTISGWARGGTRVRGTSRRRLPAAPLAYVRVTGPSPRRSTYGGNCGIEIE